MNPTNGGWLILLTLVFAMLLSIVHLPQEWPELFAWLRPNWLVVVLFFWVVEVPHRIGLISTWLLGLFVDVLLAEPLGLNGLILAGTTYLTWRFYERLRMYSVLQQCGVVFVLTLTAELMRGVVNGFGSQIGLSWSTISIALMSMVLWPFVYLLLIRLRTGMRIE